MKKEEIDKVIDKIINETDLQEQLDIFMEMFDDFDLGYGDDISDDIIYLNNHPKVEEIRHVIEIMKAKFKKDSDLSEIKGKIQSEINDKNEENEIYDGLDKIFKDNLYSYETEKGYITFKYDSKEITGFEHYEVLDSSALAMHFFSNFTLENILLENLKTMLYEQFDLYTDANEITNEFIK